MLILFVQAAEVTAAERTVLPRQIREIRIIRGNVFSESEADRYWAFRTANVLHFVTREHIVRRGLLFAEGDLVDEDLFAATERSLRALTFIIDARVEAVAVDDSTVDVEVHTHDSWTIMPGVLFESGGGLTEVGATLEDTNLGGFGKGILLQGSHKTDEGTSVTAGYRDPQVLGSRWVANSNFRASPLVDSADLALVHPFYSPDTKWAYGASGAWRREIIRSFDSGSEVGRVQELRRFAQMSAARAFGRRYHKITADLELRYDDQDYKLLEGTRDLLPADSLAVVTSVGLSFRAESFVKEKRIRRMTLTEDIRLGLDLGVRVGRAGIPIPVGSKHWAVTGSYRHAFRLARGQYLFFSSSVSTEDDRNTILAAGGEYYYKWLPWQTLALNVDFNHGWKLDASREFIVGGDSGLRGFPARRFDGEKSMLINLESRLYSPIEILTVALGAVAFVDMGGAWKSGARIDFGDLGYSAGFGVRLGLTRAPNEPTGRIDLGWPLSEGGFALTIGAEQQF